jgi:hypothetical protein
MATATRTLKTRHLSLHPHTLSFCSLLREFTKVSLSVPGVTSQSNIEMYVLLHGPLRMATPSLQVVFFISLFSRFTSDYSGFFLASLRVLVSFGSLCSRFLFFAGYELNEEDVVLCSIVTRRTLPCCCTGSACMYLSHLRWFSVKTFF